MAGKPNQVVTKWFSAPFWTYSRSKKRCWLKLSRSNLTAARDLVSGNYDCGTKYQNGKAFIKLISQMLPKTANNLIWATVDMTEVQNIYKS